MTFYVNLYAGPGSGKSTGAAFIFSMLKMHDVNAEYVPEVAKDLAWEGTLRVFYDQFAIGAEQHKRQFRLLGKADVVVCDSPLIQQQVYCQDKMFGELMDNLASRYDNRNYFIKRGKSFNPKGRNHNLEQAITVDENLLKLLDEKKVPYTTVNGTVQGYMTIVDQVLAELNIPRKIQVIG